MEEDSHIEHLLSPENTIPLSQEQVDRLAEGDELVQALSAYLQTDQADPFFAEVARFFGVSRLAPVVQEYMKATRQVGEIKGPFRLDGLVESLRAHGTWEDWMTDKWGDGVFPGIYIGYETYGTEFLLLLSTGHIITLHHDATLQEVASDIAEAVSSREQFLEALIAEGSSWSLAQLIQLQTALWKEGIEDWTILVDDDEEPLRQRVKALICSLRQWSASEFEEASKNNNMEFLGILSDAYWL